MQFFCCIVSVAPLRKEATHKSEIISELLLGECVEYKEHTNDFIYVNCLYDGYEGWCQKTQLTEVNESFAESNHTVVTTKPITTALCDGKNIFIPAGSFIGNYTNGQLQISKTKIEFFETPHQIGKVNIENNINEIINSYVNTPYLWGGKSIFGIDCSGFVQQVFKILGIPLPRDAYQQATFGEIVDFLQETKLGDLAFFDNKEGKITHVGIIVNNQQIVHASGKVKIDKIDNMGIVHADTGERTHQLRLIKRILV